MTSKRVHKKIKKDASVKKAAAATQAKPAQRSAPKPRKSRQISWKPLAITGCVIILVIAVLYPVMREYYQTLRTEQRLQAQIEAVTARNEAVQAENEALNTPEGIENQAQSDLGWTKEGENAAVVTNEQGTIDNVSRLPDHLDKDSITAPKTWYYNILDFVFFVHE